VRISLRIEGIGEATRDLRELQAQADKPAAPLLQLFGAEMVPMFQAHILDGGGDAAREHGGWRPLDPRTLRIRRRLGYDERPLLRKGQLFHSIRTLSQSDTEVEVGTVHEIAEIVHEGGRESAPYNEGGTRDIPARPFILFSAQELEDIQGLFGDYYLGEGADA
jgi:phage gpG-like protein